LRFILNGNRPEGLIRQEEEGGGGEGEEKEEEDDDDVDGTFSKFISIDLLCRLRCRRCRRPLLVALNNERTKDRINYLLRNR
jgi:hypothetical protein